MNWTIGQFKAGGDQEKIFSMEVCEFLFTRSSFTGYPRVGPDMNDNIVKVKSKFLETFASYRVSHNEVC